MSRILAAREVSPTSAITRTPGAQPSTTAARPSMLMASLSVVQHNSSATPRPRTRRSLMKSRRSTMAAARLISATTPAQGNAVIDNVAGSTSFVPGKTGFYVRSTAAGAIINNRGLAGGGPGGYATAPVSTMTPAPAPPRSTTSLPLALTTAAVAPSSPSVPPPASPTSS